MVNRTFEAQVAVCVSDNQGCPAWQYAESSDIPTMQWPALGSKQGDPASAEQLLHALENTYRADFVILAGFMKLVPDMVVQRYQQAMLNIHPALLPAFGGKGLFGRHVHRVVVASGVKFTGPTVHFVDKSFDTGPILAQRVVPVQPDDSPETVAAKVLRQENEVYPEAVAALVEGRIVWRRDGVPILLHHSEF